MNAKGMRSKKVISALFLILTCFVAFSQNNMIEKRQDECTELKNWFVSGDIIVETIYDEQDVKWVKEDGYVCAKAKINRVLKGSLAVGSYINIDINSPQKTAVIVTEDEIKNVGILTKRAIVIIQKTNLKEAFITDNKGVYATKGKIYRLQDFGFDNHIREVNGKKETFNSTQEFYKKLNRCCGVELTERKVK